MEHSKRKKLRLPGYDYSQAGGYFITICTHQRRCVLSGICRDGEGTRAQVILTALGQILQDVLEETAADFGIGLDAYVLMPNHIHLLLRIEDRDDRKRVTVGQYIGAFKSIATKRWREECEQRGVYAGKLWQRGFYDHILRNEADYYEKLRYIDENPDRWLEDGMYVRM